MDAAFLNLARKVPRRAAPKHRDQRITAAEGARLIGIGHASSHARRSDRKAPCPRRERPLGISMAFNELTDRPGRGHARHRQLSPKGTASWRCAAGVYIPQAPIPSPIRRPAPPCSPGHSLGR